MIPLIKEKVKKKKKKKKVRNKGKEKKQLMQKAERTMIFIGMACPSSNVFTLFCPFLPSFGLDFSPPGSEPVGHIRKILFRWVCAFN
jgi:hypothetical protein